MSQLPDKTGIACDYCHSEINYDFVYYSWDFRRIRMVNNTRLTGNGDIILSIDICDRCMDIFKDRIRVAYKPPSGNNIYCDISGAQIPLDNSEYYLCNVTEVKIKFSDAKLMCVKCNNPMVENQPCGKCGSLTADFKATINADDKYLEIVFSDRMFSMLQYSVNKA